MLELCPHIAMPIPAYLCLAPLPCNEALPLLLEALFVLCMVPPLPPQLRVTFSGVATVVMGHSATKARSSAIGHRLEVDGC